MPLSDPVVRALRHADLKMNEVERGDIFSVYEACRAAASAIAPVDDFYIALVKDRDRRISYPYLFSNGRYLETGSLTYGPGGVVAWIAASHKPYRFSDDGGALLNRGVRFGDDELSADAVVVPMIDDEGLVGIIGALSDTPSVFTDEIVTAMTWLAGLVLDRLQSVDPGRRLNLSLVYPELEDDGRAGALMAVNRTSAALTGVAAEIDDVRLHLEELAHDGTLEQRLAALSRRCFEVQAGIITRVGRHASADGIGGVRTDPLEGLSPRERDVVALVTSRTGDPGNAGIARALDIGTATVKTHVSSALGKLGLQHRSELRWLVHGGPWPLDVSDD
ncbi:LuxR C-terminal-related transcriptional regulator [Terrabacter terrigena]|uniref:LuxR C-terminal-related transcriptional regulator n=1 Tax=Terrabacter terrigena TaxID=574718 RepID=A0ABW3MW33_9MICO